MRSSVGILERAKGVLHVYGADKRYGVDIGCTIVVFWFSGKGGQMANSAFRETHALVHRLEVLPFHAHL